MTDRVDRDEVELLAKCLKDAADAPTMWGPSRSVCDDAADALLALLAERDRLREAITWASVITSHGMGLSTSEERTLHSVLTSALKGDQT